MGTPMGKPAWENLMVIGKIRLGKTSGKQTGTRNLHGGFVRWENPGAESLDESRRF